MLKAELDTELGYSKNSQNPKQTETRRNGSYSTVVRKILSKRVIDFFEKCAIILSG